MLAKDILIKAGLEKSTWGAHIIIAERDGGFSEEQQDLSALCQILIIRPGSRRWTIERTGLMVY
jgi:hypothetical protein